MAIGRLKTRKTLKNIYHSPFYLFQKKLNPLMLKKNSINQIKSKNIFEIRQKCQKLMKKLWHV